MQEIPFGQGFYDEYPVLQQADTKLLQQPPTLAVGDIQYKAAGPTANLGAVAAAFTVGNVAKPILGETVTGGTSTKTAKVIGSFLTSGAWSGAGAGTLFVESASGAFTPGETLTGSVSGCTLTLTADFVAQPTALSQVGSGGHALALTSTETSADRFKVPRIDAAGAQWCSDWLDYITTDHPSAGKPNGCIAAVAAHASSQTASLIRLNAAPQGTPVEGMFVLCTTPGSAAMQGYIKSYSTVGGWYITLYDGMPAALTSAWTVYVYGDARNIARIAATENVALSAQQKLDVNTEADTALADYAPGFKKNTAVTAFTFKMVDPAGNPVTGATVTATRSLDGAAYAACANAASEIGGGSYKITLAAADMNGDIVALRFTATGCQQRDVTILTET